MYANSICTAQRSLVQLEMLHREIFEGDMQPFTTTYTRVSCRGGVGGLEFPPSQNSPPEILKLSMVIIVVPSLLAIYMLLDIHVSMCYQNVVWVVCPRLRQKQSEWS